MTTTMAEPRVASRQGDEAAGSEIRQAGTIRVLVIDGHPVTRWGLVQMTNERAEMGTVGEAGTAAEALALAASLSPDVVTVGVSLPDRDGLDLARELRDRYPALGIVVLTAQGDDDVLFRALDSGASAFVSKFAAAPEILSAITHSAVAASSFTSAGLAQAMRRRAAQPQRPLLSPRELQVLSLLQNGRSVPEVASLLFVSRSTAKTHVARLYEKLGATNRAQALMTAVRLGLGDRPMLAVADQQQVPA
jgi:DNA-binding NarL/FixJ family response regulator